MKQATLQQANAMFFKSLRGAAAQRSEGQDQGGSTPAAGAPPEGGLDSDSEHDLTNTGDQGSQEIQGGGDAGGEPQQSASGDADDEMARLTAEYKERFGKMPHSQAKAETLRKKLAEAAA